MQSIWSSPATAWPQGAQQHSPPLAQPTGPLESPVPAVSARCPLVSGDPGALWTFLGMLVAVSTHTVVGHTPSPVGQSSHEHCAKVSRGKASPSWRHWDGGPKVGSAGVMPRLESLELEDTTMVGTGGPWTVGSGEWCRGGGPRAENSQSWWGWGTCEAPQLGTSGHMEQVTGLVGMRDMKSPRHAGKARQGVMQRMSRGPQSLQALVTHSMLCQQWAPRGLLLSIL